MALSENGNEDMPSKTMETSSTSSPRRSFEELWGSQLMAAKKSLALEYDVPEDDQELETFHEHLRDIINDLMKHGDIYLTRVVPLCDGICREVNETLGPYENMIFDDWSSHLSQSIKHLTLYQHCCNELINCHEKLLEKINIILEHLGTCASQLENKRNVDMKTQEEMKMKAQRYKKFSTASSFVPIVGIIPALTLNSSSKTNKKIAGVLDNALQSACNIRDVISVMLLPTIDEIKDVLEETLSFLKDKHSLLDILVTYGKRGQDENRKEQEINRFFIVMKGRAVELIINSENPPLPVVKNNKGISKVSNEEIAALNDFFDVSCQTYQKD